MVVAASRAPLLCLLLVSACRMTPDGASGGSPGPGSQAQVPQAQVPQAQVPQAQVPQAQVSQKKASPAAAGVTRLGAPLRADLPQVALTEVARTPGTFADRTFATTGTVTAVCQHMGCWMEIRDDASEAHVKMAGHAFFVPKTASGRRARVMGRLVRADEPEAACAHGGGTAGGGGCRAEAQAQLGRPLPKLELVAEGIEILDS